MIRMPKWVPYAAAASLTLMLCLTINYRAFVELNKETAENGDRYGGRSKGTPKSITWCEYDEAY